MSSKIETSRIIGGGGNSKKFLGPSRTGVFARNDKGAVHEGH